jgi:hypothetical protein
MLTAIGFTLCLKQARPLPPCFGTHHEAERPGTTNKQQHKRHYPKQAAGAQKEILSRSDRDATGQEQPREEY